MALIPGKVFNLMKGGVPGTKVTIRKVSNERVNSTALYNVETKRVATEIYVVPAIDKVMLSLNVYKGLGIVPLAFPKQVSSATVEKDQRILEMIKRIPNEPISEERAPIKEKMVDICSDVFQSQNEKTLKPMIREPMKIHLGEDVIPYVMTAARQIPFALRDQIVKSYQRSCRVRVLGHLV